MATACRAMAGRLMSRLVVAAPRPATRAVLTAASRQYRHAAPQLSRRLHVCAAAKAPAAVKESKSKKKKEAEPLVALPPQALLFEYDEASEAEQAMKLMADALAANVKVAIGLGPDADKKTALAALSGPKGVGKRADAVHFYTQLGDGVKDAAAVMGVEPAKCVLIAFGNAGQIRLAKLAKMRVVHIPALPSDAVVAKPKLEADDGPIVHDLEADAVFPCIGRPGEENVLLEDLTVPNGAFWVEDEADWFDPNFKPKAKPKKKKAGDSDGDSGSESDEEQ